MSKCDEKSSNFFFPKICWFLPLKKIGVIYWQNNIPSYFDFLHFGEILAPKKKKADSMKFYKNELVISHSNTKLNICQNVGPNELCIVFILFFYFSLSLCVSVSLFKAKQRRREEEEEERGEQEQQKENST